MGSSRSGEEQILRVITEDLDGICVGPLFQFEANLTLDGWVQKAFPAVVNREFELRRPVSDGAQDTVCDCLEKLWQQARTAIAARARFFRHLGTISAYLLFPDWTSLMNILISGKAPPT